MSALRTIIRRYFPGGFWFNNANYFYLTDHLGSVRQVTDSSGNVVARFEYDPYGRRTQTYGTLQVDIGFTGHFHHGPSGLIFAPLRIYDPETGRWISRDPIQERGGLNLYAYCGGDPVNLYDGTGFAAFKAGPTQFWKDIVHFFRNTSPLAGQMVTHYMEGKGKPITLSEASMAAVAPHFILRAAFSDLLLNNPRLNLTLENFTVPLEAGEGGTLGNFTATLNGTLCQDANGWSFRGTVTFEDVYDFDPHWLNTHRTFGGEMLTIFGAYFIPGTPYKVTSVSTAISQTAAQVTPRWIGSSTKPHNNEEYGK